MRTLIFSAVYCVVGFVPGTIEQALAGPHQVSRAANRPGD
jgi:hypothetical protein